MVKKVFIVGETMLLGQYVQNHDVVYAEPPGASHVAHVTWLVPGARSLDNRSGIDYFLLKELPKDADVRIVRPEMVPADVETTYSVICHLLQGHKDLEAAVRQVTAHDIYTHTTKQVATQDMFAPKQGKTEPHVREPSRLSIVERIDTTQPITVGKHVTIEAEGKQDFYPDCILDLNLDFSRWCFSGITPDMKLAPWLTCIYCYAGYKHKAFPDVYSVDKRVLLEQIEDASKKRAVEGKQTRFIRLGKRVDCGPDFFRPQLVNTLEACVDAGLSAIFPTKYLSFNKDVAALLRRTGSTLLFSFGNDAFQPGTVLHGCNEEWRWETAKRYLATGVRTVPYVIVDAVKEEGGEYFRDNFRQALKFPQMQVLPIRIRYNDVANRILGGWGAVIGNHTDGLFGESVGGYDAGVDSTRLHNFVHPSIAEKVKENNGSVRMCSHNLDTTWCGKCFMSGEKGMIGSAPHKPRTKKTPSRRRK